LTVLELFCGIGGCAAALGARARVAAAIDQKRQALEVYARNFPHTVHANAIESLPLERWRAWEADLWWLSPPCVPYTTRGRQRDSDDPRAKSLLATIDHLSALRPRYVALENVPGFDGSRVHQRLRDTLDAEGYVCRETLLCPTELGAPMRRRRFYLVAALGTLDPWPPRDGPLRMLADALDPSAQAELWCDPSLADRYAGALDVVDAGDPAATTACFTSAYGRALVRSGSYLRTPSGLRRFSPAEILRLLDFPPTFTLPPAITLQAAWPLVGNSVSVSAVRWVLSAIPELATGDGSDRQG
jgi:site-specific DNA-cytosine methylase